MDALRERFDRTGGGEAHERHSKPGQGYQQKTIRQVWFHSLGAGGGEPGEPPPPPPPSPFPPPPPRPPTIDDTR